MHPLVMALEVCATTVAAQLVCACCHQMAAIPGEMAQVKREDGARRQVECVAEAMRVAMRQAIHRQSVECEQKLGTATPLSPQEIAWAAVTTEETLRVVCEGGWRLGCAT